MQTEQTATARIIFSNQRSEVLGWQMSDYVTRYKTESCAVFSKIQTWRFTSGLGLGGYSPGDPSDLSITAFISVSGPLRALFYWSTQFHLVIFLVSLFASGYSLQLLRYCVHSAVDVFLRSLPIADANAHGAPSSPRRTAEKSLARSHD
jgi:hypothetical protein